MIIYKVLHCRVQGRGRAGVWLQVMWSWLPNRLCTYWVVLWRDSTVTTVSRSRCPCIKVYSCILFQTNCQIPVYRNMHLHLWFFQVTGSWDPPKVLEVQGREVLREGVPGGGMAADAQTWVSLYQADTAQSITRHSQTYGQDHYQAQGN